MDQTIRSNEATSPASNFGGMKECKANWLGEEVGASPRCGLGVVVQRAKASAIPLSCLSRSAFLIKRTADRELPPKLASAILTTENSNQTSGKEPAPDKDPQHKEKNGEMRIVTDGSDRQKCPEDLCLDYKDWFHAGSVAEELLLE